MHVIKTAPTDEPITLNDVRSILGITQIADTSRDAVISAQIIAARSWAEHYTRRALMPQTWFNYLNAFSDVMDLKCSLQSVTSIKYLDSAGVLQTLSPTIYYVDLVNSQVALANGKSWPSTYVQHNSVIIEFVCGYLSDDEVPQDIKEAIKFLVAHWENYQTSIEGVRITTVPYAVQQLLNNYVDYRGYF